MKRNSKSNLPFQPETIFNYITTKRRINCAETDMAARVIVQSIMDMCAAPLNDIYQSRKREAIREDATAFFNDRRLEQWSAAATVSSHFIKRLANECKARMICPKSEH